MSLSPGIYTITNVQCGNLAAAKDANDQTSLYSSAINLTQGFKWVVQPSVNDKRFTLRNNQHGVYASCDNRPRSNALIFNSREPYLWIIEWTGKGNYYTISNPDTRLFWNCPDDMEETTIGLDSSSGDRRNHWIFTPQPVKTAVIPAIVVAPSLQSIQTSLFDIFGMWYGVDTQVYRNQGDQLVLRAVSVLKDINRELGTEEREIPRNSELVLYKDRVSSNFKEIEGSLRHITFLDLSQILNCIEDISDKLVNAHILLGECTRSKSKLGSDLQQFRTACEADAEELEQLIKNIEQHRITRNNAKVIDDANKAIAILRNAASKYGRALANLNDGRSTLLSVEGARSPGSSRIVKSQPANGPSVEDFFTNLSLASSTKEVYIPEHGEDSLWTIFSNQVAVTPEQRRLEERLKAITSNTTSKLQSGIRDWRRIINAFNRCAGIELEGEQEFKVSSCIKEGSISKLESYEPKQNDIDDVISWFKTLVNDDSILSGTRTGIKSLARTVATTGGSNAKDYNEKKVTEFGLVRYLDEYHPRFVVYQLHLVVWTAFITNTLSFSRNYSNGIRGTIHRRVYVPVNKLDVFLKEEFQKIKTTSTTA